MQKTIKKAAKEYSEHVSPHSAWTAKNAETSFIKGVEFAQQWISVEEEMPENYLWVLVKTDLCRYPCEVAEMRGKRFASTSNIEIKNVTHWRPISFL